MAPEFSVRSDSVDVEQIMTQIRTRIREKRGVDYTEEEIRELANVKLETFLDPSRVRSELLTYYREMRSSPTAGATLMPPAPPNYVFEAETPYASSPGPVGRSIQLIRRLLNPLLKLFINPNPIVHVLNMQSQINAQNTVRIDRLFRSDHLNYEILHNLVVEMTRLGIEVKNLKMRIESLSSRLEFDERRARAFEAVVQYKPGAGPGAEAGRSTPRAQTPAQPPGQAPRDADADAQGAAVKGEAQRNRRRRRRRPRSGAAAPQAGGVPEGGVQPGVAAGDGGGGGGAADDGGPDGRDESTLPFDADRPAAPDRTDGPTEQ